MEKDSKDYQIAEYKKINEVLYEQKAEEARLTAENEEIQRKEIQLRDEKIEELEKETARNAE